MSEKAYEAVFSGAHDAVGLLPVAAMAPAHVGFLRAVVPCHTPAQTVYQGLEKAEQEQM